MSVVKTVLTVEECWAACIPFLKTQIESSKQLGLKLIEFRDMLSGTEFERLKNKFMEHGFNSRWVKATMMLADGTLHPDLYHSGISYDKLLNMRQSSHKNLLDPKFKIPYLKEDGTTDEMPFCDMTDELRRQVIGRNRILRPDEQKAFGAKKGKSSKIYGGHINYVSFDMENQLIMRGDKFDNATMDVSLFKKQLRDRNQLQAFLDVLEK